MPALCRIVLVTCMLTSMRLKAVVEGELRTRDGKYVYSFGFPFTVDFYHKYNFSKCIVLNIIWHNSKTWDTSLQLDPTRHNPVVVISGNFNYSAQMLSNKSAVTSSMSGYVNERNESEQEYKVSIRASLSCIYFDSRLLPYTSILKKSSIGITARYCPLSRQPKSPKLRLNNGTRKSFNDLSKVHCDDGAELYDGNMKVSSNESITKCGPFSEWLDNFACWFVPEVQLSPLPASFYNKGENVQFSCDVSEGYPYCSSGELRIGVQKWSTKNKFIKVRMTEWHNYKTVFCTASNEAGTSYSKSKNMTIYFPPLLESRILYLKSGESNYSVMFSSNPPQNSTSLRFLLQVNGSTNATIKGFWQEENTLKYGTWLQKFTAPIYLTENSTLFFEYDKYGINSSEKLDIIQSYTRADIETTSRSLTVDSHTAASYNKITVRDATDDYNCSGILYATGGILGLWLFVTLPAIAILMKQRQALAEKAKDTARSDADYCNIERIEKTKQEETTDQSTCYDNLQCFADTSGKSPYENVSMSSPYEEIDASKSYETIAA